jgi:hypothetical protein
MIFVVQGQFGVIVQFELAPHPAYSATFSLMEKAKKTH